MTQLLRTFWKENSLIILIMGIASACTTIASFSYSWILNGIIAQSSSQFYQGCLILIASYLSYLLFKYAQIKYSSQLISKMVLFLRERVIDKLTSQSPNTFKQTAVGSHASKLSNDIIQIEQQGIMNVYELLANFISLCFALGSLLLIHWLLFIIVCIQLIILLQLPKLLDQKLKQFAMEFAGQNEQANQYATELLAGFSTFYLLQNLHFLRQKLVQAYDLVRQAKNKQMTLMAKVIVLGGLGNICGQVTAIALAGYFALQHEISIGAVTTVLSLATIVFNTAGNMSQYLATIRSVEPLFEKNQYFESTEDKKTAQAKQVTNFDIRFADVTFQYPNSAPLFQHLDYHFKEGKKYAIVGASGKGKSTLFQLMMGLLPVTNGKIYLGKEDYQKLGTTTLRNQILYLEQNPYLFSGTIRENLVLGEDFSDGALQQALQQAGLGELKAQLDYLLTEHGNNLSGGQKQRLVLARGLLRKKKIILMDESTANVDTKTARQIEQFIFNLKECTVLMITHHLDEQLAKQCEQILKL